MSSEHTPIKAMLILEVMGRPPEHLTEVLKNIVNKIDEEKDVSVTAKKINEPIEIETQKGMYSNYAEIEIEAKTPSVLSGLMFRYMPSHIEIISPENFYTTNVSYTELMNELTRRLHVYDNIARVLQMEKVMMEKKLAELSPKQVSSESVSKEKPAKKVLKKKILKRK